MGLLRLFTGSGRFPDDLRQTLTAEGLQLIDEGLSGSITFRNYRAPGRYSSLRKEAMTGSIAITQTRLVVWTGRAKHMDVGRAQPQWHAIHVKLDRPDRICIGYDPAAFHPDRSGQVELRFTTQQAQQAFALLQ